ncbi:MAG: peptidase P60 [Asticcacaulis sp.]
MSAILTEARTWLQTPYQHQMSLKGVGCDCLGVVRGVWRALYGAEPCALPAYSPDWAETGTGEPLLEALRRHFTPVELAQVVSGDVLVFRMRMKAPAKHLAILSAGDGVHDPLAKIIHAYWSHAVVESWLGPVWRQHVVAAFRFPAPN